MVMLSKALTAVVHIVDDDPAILKMAALLVTAQRMDVATYSTAEDFLQSFDPALPGCVVTDVRMPGMTGVELQEQLAERGACIPVIVMSGNADVPTVVRAMRNHAIDVLEKPFQPQVLLERIQRAVERDRELRFSAGEAAEVQRKISRLTAREREVAELVVAGHANKLVARKLDITEKTVEAHRGRLMKKMGLGNVVDLVRLMCGAAATKEIPEKPR